MDVNTLTAFDDNDLRLAHAGGRAVAIDPSDANPVLAALSTHQLSLECILVTHHHPDHIGGVATIKAATGAHVYGPADTRIAVDSVVNEGDVLHLLHSSVQVEVLAAPGQTRSHVAYLADDKLFCGNTVFVLGCGRLFEGSSEQMSASLARALAKHGVAHSAVERFAPMRQRKDQFNPNQVVHP